MKRNENIHCEGCGIYGDCVCAPEGHVQNARNYRKADELIAAIRQIIARDADGRRR